MQVFSSESVPTTLPHLKSTDVALQPRVSVPTCACPVAMHDRTIQHSVFVFTATSFCDSVHCQQPAVDRLRPSASRCVAERIRPFSRQRQLDSHQCKRTARQASQMHIDPNWSHHAVQHNLDELKDLLTLQQRSQTVSAIPMAKSEFDIPAAPILLPKGPWKAVEGSVNAPKGFKAQGWCCSICKVQLHPCQGSQQKYLAVCGIAQISLSKACPRSCFKQVASMLQAWLAGFGRLAQRQTCLSSWQMQMQ